MDETMSGHRGQARLYCLVLVCRVVYALWAQARPEGYVSIVFGNRLGRVSNVSGLMLVRLRRRPRFLRSGL